MTDATNTPAESKSLQIQIPRWFIFATLFSVAVHVFFGFVSARPEPSNDEREYLDLALKLKESGEFVLPSGDRAKRMPVYPALLALLRGEERISIWYSKIDIVQSLLAAAATCLFALCAARLANSSLAGVIAALTSALYGPFIFLQTQYLTETLTIFLFASSLAAYLLLCIGSDSTTSRRRIGYILVSVFLGIATLTRTNMLVCILPFAVDALIRQRSMRRWSAVFLLLIPAALMCIGWGVRNSNAVGKFTLSTIGGLNFYLGNNPDYAKNPGLGGADYDRFDELRREGMSEIEADAALFAEGRHFVTEYPSEAFANLGRKLKVYFTPSTKLFGPSLPVILTLPFAILYWRERRKSLAERDSHLRGRLVVILAVVSGILFVAWFTVRLMAFNAGNDVAFPLPFVSVHYLLPLGLVALFFSRPRFEAKWLFVGLFSIQLATALVFIPLSRIRWSMDGVLIVALAVGITNLFGFESREARRGDA